MNFKVIGGLVIAVSAVILGSCSADPDSAGLEYMPDMYRSPAVEPYVDYGHIRENENVDAKMRLSAMTPPNGSVPYYGTDSLEVSLMLPYHRKANIEFRESHGMFGEELAPANVNTYELAAADQNPMLMSYSFEVDPKGDTTWTNETLASAKSLFNNNCSHCHGEKGDGNGEMMVNGTFSGVPDYSGDVAKLSDGQLFYSIYYGKGAMGSHRSILNKKEIWTLVHYIRQFQNKDYGKYGADEMVDDVEPVSNHSDSTEVK
ncbi:MAG: cytochrome c [Crocinitomicaceae bacterium]|nr:cytochrome c [Crocinitomicaceae bacterium]